MSISAKAVKRPTTVLIFTIVLVLLGVYSATKLPIDLFPDMDIPVMIIQSSYPGAAPEEVEEKLTRPLENALSGIQGLNKITSTSSSGSTMIVLELEMGTDLNEATNQMRDRIDLVRNYLPDEATSPIIIQMDPSMLPIMSIAVEGDVSPEKLRSISEDTIIPRLEQVEGVASVSLSGGSETEVRVQISQEKLDTYGLSVTQLTQMLMSQNMTVSAGSIREGDKQYALTLSGNFNSLEDLENTPVTYLTTTPGINGVQVIPLRLKDVATVSLGYGESTDFAFVDGKACVVLMVQKQSSKNALQTSRNVHAAFDSIKEDIPSDISFNVVLDSTDFIKMAVKTVAKSAITGALLAIIVIVLFLRSLRSTLIIAISIPVSILITFALMYFSGQTLNMMTLAGLSLGIGMLVDNSIVILENIYSYRQRGAKPTVAAVLGSREMVMSITSSTLTTICVFLPMLMYGKELGIISQVFTGLAFTVVFSLLCSLAVALTLVPALSSKYLVASVKKQGDGIKKLKGYRKFTRWTLHHKALVVIVILALFALAIYMIPQIGFIYMPEQEETSVSLSITLEKGTAIDRTKELTLEFLDRSLPLLSGIKTTQIASSSSNSASITYIITTSSERTEGMDDAESVKEKLRTLFANYPEAEFSFDSTSLISLSSGGGIDIKIAGNDMATLMETTLEIQAALQSNLPDMVEEVSNTIDTGLPEIKFTYDRERIAELGFNISSLSQELKGRLNGISAGNVTVDGEEYKLKISLPDEEKDKQSTLDSVFVTNSQGQTFPLSAISSYEKTLGPSSITRENQSRVLHVSVTPKAGVQLAEAQEAVERVINEKVVLPKNITISYGGDYQDLMEGLKIFVQIIGIAALLVFAVMASQFESFKSPFIVIFTIPLAVIGIVAICYITGSQLSLITAVGLLILVGIIVNNGIVLVDYTNLLIKRGYRLEEACVEAAAARLRPILMTTLTTVLALIPMAFFPGEGSELVQPIGQTVLGGLAFGTLMTLFLMPVLYYAFNIRKEKKKLKKEAQNEKN
jgi:Cation/multidrug efflux pump